MDLLQRSSLDTSHTIETSTELTAKSVPEFPVAASKSIAATTLHKQLFQIDPRKLRYRFRRDGIKIGDLENALSAAASDALTYESAWPRQVPASILALSTDLNHLPDEVTAPKFPPHILELVEEEPSSQRLSTTKTPRSTRSKGKQQTTTPRATIEPLTASTAIAYFAKCHHRGEMKNGYFNIVPGVLYDPYNIIQVDRQHANPVHYVISSVGVLYVDPDGSSEQHSLGEWQRQAVLFRALRQLPLFRFFILRRALLNWYHNAHYFRLERFAKHLSLALLRAAPTYSPALLLVQRALSQIIDLKLVIGLESKALPLVLKSLQSAQYAIVVEDRHAIQTIYASLFSSVAGAASALLTAFRSAQDELHKFHCVTWTHESLYLQRIWKEEREANLRDAGARLGHLGNLLCLVDQLLHSHAICIVKQRVRVFLRELLALKPAPVHESALLSPVLSARFRLDLCFGGDGKLSTAPTTAAFQNFLLSCVHSIAQTLVSQTLYSDGGYGDLSKIFAGADVQTPANVQPSPENNASPLSLNSASAALSLLDSADSEQQTLPLGTGRALSRPFLYHKFEELMEHSRATGLLVEGLGFQGSYTPLRKSDLIAALDADPEYRQLVGSIEQSLKEACDDAQNFLNSVSWLEAVHDECGTLLRDEAAARERYAKLQPNEIEAMFNDIRQWIDQVSSINEVYHGALGIFHIDCVGLQDELLAALNAIFGDLVTFVNTHVTRLAFEFSAQLAATTDQLVGLKSTDFTQFAQLVHLYHTAKQKMQQFKQEFDYIQGTLDVLRISGRRMHLSELELNLTAAANAQAAALRSSQHQKRAGAGAGGRADGGSETGEEESLESRVKNVWESFILIIQQAADYISANMPEVQCAFASTVQYFSLTLA